MATGKKNKMMEGSSIYIRAFNVLVLSFMVGMLLPSMGRSDTEQEPHTRVVLLGTGNPQIDPDRSGAATAVVVGKHAYLVDFGAGVMRRAARAAEEKGIMAVRPTNLKVVFLTHLHSDHTVGYPDLILSPWVMGRRSSLRVYGPTGLQNMTDHILAAYQENIRIRTEGLEQIPKESLQVLVHEIKPGVVFRDRNVTVTAFPTKHGDWQESYGYRFDTRDRSIVIPGDTTPTQATIDACNGCDVLIHEALTMKFLSNPMRPNAQGYDIKNYSQKYHTSTKQLAELAQKARPKLLVLHHNSITLKPTKRPFASTPDDLLREIREAGYEGEVVVGRDLDVY